jgi:hypothetical protein
MKIESIGIANKDPKDPAPINPPLPIPWRKTEKIAIK